MSELPPRDRSPRDRTIPQSVTPQTDHRPGLQPRRVYRAWALPRALRKNMVWSRPIMGGFMASAKR